MLYSTHKADELGKDTSTLVCGMMHSDTSQMKKLKSFVLVCMIK